jgi:hypothetical protein
MDQFEEMANWLSDQDHGWWPFLFLRPARTERIGFGRTLTLAALYGVVIGLSLNVVFALRGRPVGHPLEYPVGCTLVLAVLYQLTFAHFWNRRAARLARRASLR